MSCLSNSASASAGNNTSTTSCGYMRPLMLAGGPHVSGAANAPHDLAMVYPPLASSTSTFTASSSAAAAAALHDLFSASVASRSSTGLARGSFSAGNSGASSLLSAPSQQSMLARAIAAFANFSSSSSSPSCSSPPSPCPSTTPSTASIAGYPSQPAHLISLASPSPSPSPLPLPSPLRPPPSALLMHPLGPPLRRPCDDLPPPPPPPPTPPQPSPSMNMSHVTPNSLASMAVLLAANSLGLASANHSRTHLHNTGDGDANAGVVDGNRQVRTDGDVGPASRALTSGETVSFSMPAARQTHTTADPLGLPGGPTIAVGPAYPNLDELDLQNVCFPTGLGLPLPAGPGSRHLAGPPGLTTPSIAFQAYLDLLRSLGNCCYSSPLSKP
ncbi:unnamed protein product [Protopolystoma xenopodis]|uniref:Uncharacterized protein n=1 Tax=Protopolystoma xenopodis TaxID=117903 RepID=A0A3S5BQR6_9PLAT|nr:unnamed protein product [Protopolystoma xenopodis]